MGSGFMGSGHWQLAWNRGPLLSTCDSPPEIASATQGPFAGEVEADFHKE